MSEEAVSRLQEAFRISLQLEEEPDWDSLTYQGIPEWDSVGHLELVARIEEAFDVLIDVDDVLDMSSFDRAKEILGRLGVA